MKEFDIVMLLAVLQEILGHTFWPLVAGAVAVTIAFAFLLLRSWRLEARLIVASELIGAVAGFLALVFAFYITNSSITDIGGPIDWIMLIGIWAAGAVGGFMLSYLAMAYGKNLNA